MKFNFTKDLDANAVNLNGQGKVPLFSESLGDGFTTQTVAIPPREVDTAKIIQTPEGFQITETDSAKFKLVDAEGQPVPVDKSTNHNFGGMVFRVRVPAGAYHIQVVTTSSQEEVILSVSGLSGPQILKQGYWNAAKTLPIQHVAEWKNATWSFDFVTGSNAIDIEIEPLKPNVPVGVSSITLTPIPVQESGDLPTLFLLGDSTVKSYIFEEAPMCGWGQVISRLIDQGKAQVKNYSQGGRSLKSMYIEARLNDLLLAGKKGDVILLQSGHNDERDDAGAITSLGETSRFGRGSSEEMYRQFLESIFIPAIISRGMTPIFVTPITRINIDTPDGTPIQNSFTKRKFPQVMREVAQKHRIILLDLNRKSVEYINEVGIESVKGIYMSMEPGESPAKMADGSFANGNPQNRCDGTHYKEALGNQCCRILMEELFHQQSDSAQKVLSYLKEEVKAALKNNDWSIVYPELCPDVIKGANAYYRNQIEKVLQLGILKKSAEGLFHPQSPIDVRDFSNALCDLYHLSPEVLSSYEEGPMTREIMGCILLGAFQAYFGKEPENRPVYMTDFDKPATNQEPQPPQYASFIRFEQLEDLPLLSPEYFQKVKDAYELGLIRSEKGIVRGQRRSGTALCPKEIVTRGKAAKALYFMWVLIHDIHRENHL